MLNGTKTKGCYIPRIALEASGRGPRSQLEAARPDEHRRSPKSSSRLPLSEAGFEVFPHSTSDLLMGQHLAMPYAM